MDKKKLDKLKMPEYEISPDAESSATSSEETIEVQPIKKKLKKATSNKQRAAGLKKVGDALASSQQEPVVSDLAEEGAAFEDAELVKRLEKLLNLNSSRGK